MNEKERPILHNERRRQEALRREAIRVIEDDLAEGEDDLLDGYQHGGAFHDGFGCAMCDVQEV